jgi:hypothetical protein
MNKNYYNQYVIGLALAVGNCLAEPIIMVQPKSQSAAVFDDVTFSVTVDDLIPMSFQWSFNSMPIKGEVNSAFTITNIQNTNAGTYSVLVSDFNGSVSSQPATLRIVPFKSIYCFGFSWTDTRDTICGWGPPDYFPQRACNGPIWPEYLSASLGLPYIPTNNLARCGADSSGVLSQVSNLKPPARPAQSLYFLWCGAAGDFLYAASSGALPTRTIPYIAWTDDAAWNHLIQSSLVSASNAVEQLYLKGARTILVQNAFDFSSFPLLISEIGTNQARTLKLNERTTRFNQALAQVLESIDSSKPDVRLIMVDTQTRLDDLISNPNAYGFTKAFPSALGDASLKDKSFTGPGQDYVFWDTLHATSKVHALIAEWNLEALTNSILERLNISIANDSLHVALEHLQIGRDYIVQTSPDLLHWMDVENITASAGTNQWTENIIRDTTAFYRLNSHTSQ